MLGRVQLGVVLSNIPLFDVAFWVQIHNLPLGFMTSTVGTHLGNYIGTFLEYGKSNNTSLWRKYMRIRVKLGHSDQFCDDGFFLWMLMMAVADGS